MAVEFRTQLNIFQSLRAFLSEQTSGSLTDFNVGSVLNSILYTFSNSLGSLYSTAQNIYDAAFVSTATSDDLDRKVADFGLSRKDATQSTVTLTFFRTSASVIDNAVPAGTVVATQTIGELVPIEFITTETGTIFSQISNESHTYSTGISTYNLDSRLVSSIVAITGTASSSAGHAFVKNVDYQLNQATASQHKVEWLSGDTPDDATIFYVTYKPLSIDVTAQASEAGDNGDVAAGTITIIPNPPDGIDGVTNYSASTGGLDQESDEALRERVPLFLSTLARATKDALRGAALDVTGVVSVSVSEPDYPTGLVTLIIDDGSGTASDTLIRNVKDAIDGTESGIESDTVEAYRAAGIWVNVTAPNIRSINFTVSATSQAGYNTTTVQSSINTAISNYTNSLGAGENIVRSQVIEEIMGVSGVIDMDLANLSINGATTGNVSIGSSEVARTGVLTITVTSG